MAYYNSNVNILRGSSGTSKKQGQTTRAHEEDYINPYAYNGINNVYNTIGNGLNAKSNTPATKGAYNPSIYMDELPPPTTTVTNPTGNTGAYDPSTYTDELPITPTNPTGNTWVLNPSAGMDENTNSETPPPSTTIDTGGDETDEDIDAYINDIVNEIDQDEITGTTNNGNTNNGNTNNGTTTGITSGEDLLDENNFEDTYNQLTSLGNNPYTETEYNAIQALNNILQNGGYSQEEINQMMTGINQNIMNNIQPELQKAEADSYARGIGQSSVLNRAQSDIYGKAAAQMAQEQSNILQQGKQMLANAISQVQTGAANKEKLNQEWANMAKDTQLEMTGLIHQIEVDAQNNSLNWANYELEVKKLE